MKERSRIRNLLAIGLAFAAMPLVTHAQMPDPDAGAEDALGAIFSAEFKEGKVIHLPTRMAPPPTLDTTASSKTEQAHPPPAYAKVGVKLDSDIRANSVDRKRLVEVVVTFKDERRIPRFPGLLPSEERDSPANIAVVEHARRLIRSLENDRAALYDQRASSLAAAHSARAKERFWLIDAMVLEVPLSEVEALSRRDDVQHVEYVLSGAPKPASMATTRGIIRSDPWFLSFGTAGRIALLDTGLRFSHTLNSSNGSGLQMDCVNTNDGICFSHTAGWNPADTCGHGTQSGLIVMGNNALGASTRGITGIRLDSFKNSASCNTDVAATVRSIQSAIATGNKLLLEEDDDTGNEIGAISTAADAAFDSGAVVIVPVGNRGPTANSSGAPGNAHKVISIGAVDPSSLGLMEYSARGPQTDSRTKPELVAPTNAVTGSFNGDTATAMHTGTSAAAPHGAGAAAIAVNMISNNTGNVSPGLVYAFMITSGDSSGFSNGMGAGILRLPTSGFGWWGATTVTTGQTQEIAINASPASAVDVAIWWPESPSVHQDVDLSLVRPSGATAASSGSTASVFEKVRTTTSLSSGTWKVKIRGFNVTGSQTVYWAMFSR